MRRRSAPHDRAATIRGGGDEQIVRHVCEVFVFRSVKMIQVLVFDFDSAEKPLILGNTSDRLKIVPKISFTIDL